MRNNFHLSRPDEKQSGIYARFFHQGKPVKIYLQESIETKFWSTKTHRAVQSYKYEGHGEFNARLDNIEQKIKKAYHALLNESDGNNLSTKAIRKHIYEQLYPERHNKSDTTLLGFLEQLIDESERGLRLNLKTGKRISEATIKTYRTTQQHLTDFQAKGNAVNFDVINLQFYHDYKQYLIEVCKLRNNTFGKHIQILKTIMNEGLDRGLHNNRAHQNKSFKVIHEKSDAIYLTTEELKLLYALDLSNNPTYEHVRDLFVISCHTALRYSDLSRLTRENFKEDGMIHLRQQKTNDEVAIPITDVVREILQKYGDDLPPCISEQKANDYLKKIGSMIDQLNVPVTLKYIQGGKKIEQTVKKWELICNHTGRRTYATNQVLAKHPIQFIMSVTGHSTEKAFMRYVKLSQQDKARMMQLCEQESKQTTLRVA